MPGTVLGTRETLVAMADKDSFKKKKGIKISLVKKEKVPSIIEFVAAAMTAGQVNE